MFAAIIGSIVSSFFGTGLSTITSALTQAYKDKLSAQNDADRIAADEAIATLQAQRDVLVAEAASGGFQSWIRPLFALPFVIFNFKVVVWDKVLDWGSTDPLSAELFQVEMLIIGAYFVSRGAEKVARIVRG